MATKCTDQESMYKDINFCKGSKSLPGTRPYVYGVSKRDIMLWPTLPGDEAADLKAKVTYVGDFNLADGKFFHKVGMIDNQGQIQVESQGNEGAKTFKNTANIAMHGTEEDVTGYIYELNNDDMVYLVPQRNGKCRVIGNECFTTSTELSQDTGQASTDTNQTIAKVTCDDEYPAPFYAGKIHTEDGDIDATTCKPVVAGG